MARKIVKTVVSDEDLDLSGILKNLSPDGNWIVKIFRREGGSDNWLCTWAPPEVTEEALAQKYGAGRYLVRPWNEADRKWGQSKLVTISSEAEGLPATPSAIVTTSDNIQLEMVKLQMQMQQQSAERQFQMMQGFNTSMLGIMTAIIGAQKPQDLASIVSIVKDMGNSGSMVETMRSVVGLAKEIAPGGGGTEAADPITSLLTTMVPRLLEARNPPPQPQQPPPAVVLPAAQPVAAKPIEPEGKEERMRFLQQLKEKARANKDVEFWADYIEENHDEEGPAWILAVVKAMPWETLYAQLVQLDPELATEPLKTWFETLYKLLTDTTPGPIV